MFVQSPSGTGKTDTFGLITLNEIDPECKKVQIVVYSHTHELARQTYDVFKKLVVHFEPKLEVMLAAPLTKEEQKELSSRGF